MSPISASVSSLTYRVEALRSQHASPNECDVEMDSFDDVVPDPRHDELFEMFSEDEKAILTGPFARF